MDRIERKLDVLLDQLLAIKQESKMASAEMQAALDTLTTKVNNISGVVDSTVVLLNEVAQLMRDAANDPAEVLALADTIDTKATALATAAENVPVPPAPTP